MSYMSWYPVLLFHHPIVHYFRVFDRYFVFIISYFKETFDDDTWQSRWVQSAHKSDYGKFELSHGKFYGDAKINKGIKTSQDSKFYAISAEMTDFSNKDKDLIVGTCRHHHHHHHHHPQDSPSSTSKR